MPYLRPFFKGLFLLDLRPFFLNVVFNEPPMAHDAPCMQALNLEPLAHMGMSAHQLVA